MGQGVEARDRDGGTMVISYRQEHLESPVELVMLAS